jgi:hypothetical protein
MKSAREIAALMIMFCVGYPLLCLAFCAMCVAAWIGGEA